MTSSNGNTFRNTGDRWIPHTKASDADLYMFPLICAWINGWVNKREVGDLRHHGAHYDIIVMNITTSVFYLFKAQPVHELVKILIDKNIW